MPRLLRLQKTTTKGCTHTIRKIIYTKKQNKYNGVMLTQCKKCKVEILTLSRRKPIRRNKYTQKELRIITHEKEYIIR